ncbi:MAG: hypothetical protein RL538_707 [Candidatus Parcubacteria bacterium]|jgi:hypothetical protein
MDTNKLLQILTLLQADENEFSIQNRIEEIRNLVAQNSSDAGAQASDKTDELIKNIKDTRAAEFTLTETEILQKLGAEFYFGEGLITNLTDILMTRSFEVVGRLKSFHSERQSKYSHLTQLKNTLNELGVEPYIQTSPEVALKLPSDLLAIDEVSNRLKAFSHLLKAIQEPLRATGGEVVDIKITRMNRGSGEFFFGVPPDMALVILGILSDLATVVATAHQIKKSNPVNDNQYVSAEDKTKLNKLVEEIAEKTVKKFVEEVPARISKNMEPQHANSIKKHIGILVKWIPLGIHFEVVYDKQVEPVIFADNNEGKLESQKQEQLIHVRQMYKLPLKDVPLLKGEEKEIGDDETEKHEVGMETQP